MSRDRHAPEREAHHQQASAAARTRSPRAACPTGAGRCRPPSAMLPPTSHSDVGQRVEVLRRQVVADQVERLVVAGVAVGVRRRERQHRRPSRPPTPATASPGDCRKSSLSRAAVSQVAQRLLDRGHVDGSSVATTTSTDSASRREALLHLLHRLHLRDVLRQRRQIRLRASSSPGPGRPAPATATVETSSAVFGCRTTGPRMRRLMPPRPTRRLKRHSSGTRGRSTQRPSLASRAGRTVSEPITETATTRIAPVASEAKVASWTTYKPAIDDDDRSTGHDDRVTARRGCDLDGLDACCGPSRAPRARA